MTFGEGISPSVEMINGKVYFTYPKDGESIVMVGDLQTGSSLYEGKVNVESREECYLIVAGIQIVE